MQCERCDAWCYTLCINYSDDTYRIVNSVPDLHWFCSSCQPSAIQAVQTDKVVEDRCKFYMDKFEQQWHEEMTSIKDRLKEKADSKDLEALKVKLDTKAETTSVEEITTRVHAIETAMQAEHPPLNNINLSPQKQSTVRNSVNEMEERDRRKRNVLVFGLKEVNDSTEDRTTTDKTNFEKLCRAINVLAEATSTYRIGRKDNNKTRPLKVTLESEDTRNQILSQAKELRNLEAYEEIFLKRDMTPMERDEDKKLRQERDKKNDEDQKKGVTTTIWVIRRGKVVNVRRKPSHEDRGTGELPAQPEEGT